MAQSALKYESQVVFWNPAKRFPLCGYFISTVLQMAKENIVRNHMTSYNSHWVHVVEARVQAMGTLLTDDAKKLNNVTLKIYIS